VLRRRKPRVLLAFLVMTSIGLFQDRSDDMLISKYVAVSTVDRFLPCMVCVVMIGERFLGIRITSHLSGLNSIRHAVPHLCRLSKSCCNLVASVAKRITLNSRQSSANSRR